jgi:lipopolysaccharide transport system permease protein
LSDSAPVQRSGHANSAGLTALYQNAKLRRMAVLLLCGVLAYGTWLVLRWQPLPGTSDPVWSIPWWGKLLLLGGLAAIFYGLFRLGGWFIRDARQIYVSPDGIRSSATSVRWYRYLNPVGPFYKLYLHRDLVGQFTRREIEGRYRGSYLGIIWSMLLPVFMLAIYTFVFSIIFKSRWNGNSQGSQAEFAVTIFAGLIAFNVFSECMNRAPGLIIGNVNYVKKVVFPVEILPATALGAALFHSLVSVAILTIGSVILLGKFSATVVLLPLAALPLIGLCLGLGWFLASLGVYVRDTAYAVSLITQVLFFLTAIFYPISAIPEVVRPIMYLNPLTSIVEYYRQLLIWNQPIDWGPWSILTLASGVIMLLGYTWFMKTKAGFADVI